MAKKNPKKSTGKQKATKKVVKKKVVKQQPSSSISPTMSAYLALGVVLIFIFFIRVNLLDIPLERDEGGFAYIGKMALQGVPLYSELHDIKLPGLYYTYGVMMSISGFTSKGIHLGLLFFNLGAIVLLFFLIRRLFNSYIGVIAAATYAILSVSPGTLGFAAHATQLLMLPALGGIYLLLKGLEERAWWQFLVAGLLFGYAFTIKQQAVYFMIFAGLYLLFRRLYQTEKRWTPLIKEMALLITGSILPYLLILLVMMSSGRFEDFWFWTFEWPREFGTNKTFSNSMDLLDMMFKRVIDGQNWLWILSGLGLIATFFTKHELHKKVFAVLLLLMMFGGVATGFHFYQHYFVMLLPAVGLFTGIGLQLLKDKLPIDPKWSHWLSISIFVIAWLQIFSSRSDYFTNPDTTKILETTYGSNPFPESVEIGKYLNSIKQPDDKMVVFGSEPQIPFYADIPLATGDAFIYPLADGGKYSDTLQQRMIQKVEVAKPRFLVYVQSGMSWLAPLDNPLITWMKAEVTKNYRPIGMVDIFRNGAATNYVFGFEQASQYQVQSPHAILVFERVGQ